MRRLVLAGVFCAILAAGTYAHDGIHERLRAATREIDSSPCDASLYVKRAELYREHGQLDQALQDLERAHELNENDNSIDLVRGRVLHDLQCYKLAQEALDRFLARNPQHIGAHQVRARVFEALGEFRAAVREWTKAIQLSNPPTPDQYVARAKATSKLGGDQVAEALRGLEAGMKRLGSVTSLHVCALDLEVQAGKFDAALARIDELLEHSARKDSWLAKKGDILADAGRKPAARAAYKAALEAISRLRPKRRLTESTQQLSLHIRTRLVELASE